MPIADPEKVLELITGQVQQAAQADAESEVSLSSTFNCYFTTEAAVEEVSQIPIKPRVLCGKVLRTNADPSYAFDSVEVDFVPGDKLASWSQAADGLAISRQVRPNDGERLIDGSGRLVTEFDEALLPEPPVMEPTEILVESAPPQDLSDASGTVSLFAPEGTSEAAGQGVTLRFGVEPVDQGDALVGDPGVYSPGEGWTYTRRAAEGLTRLALIPEDPSWEGTVTITAGGEPVTLTSRPEGNSVVLASGPVELALVPGGRTASLDTGDGTVLDQDRAGAAVVQPSLGSTTDVLIGTNEGSGGEEVEFRATQAGLALVDTRVLATDTQSGPPAGCADTATCLVGSVTISKPFGFSLDLTSEDVALFSGDERVPVEMGAVDGAGFFSSSLTATYYAPPPEDLGRLSLKMLGPDGEEITSFSFESRDVTN